MNRHVRYVAAHLPAAVRGPDDEAIRRLLAKVTSSRDATDLILLLARCADWGRLNAETGYVAASSPRELHAYFNLLRSRGFARGDIAPYIVAGEQEYQRVIRIARRKRARTVADLAA